MTSSSADDEESTVVLLFEEESEGVENRFSRKKIFVGKISDLKEKTSIGEKNWSGPMMMKKRRELIQSSANSFR